MKRVPTAAQLRYQADRCETAKGPRCECRCGGAFHGIYHTDRWIAEEVFREGLQVQGIPARQIDWIGFDDVEIRA